MDSIETSRQFLAAHDWDVERAINTALTSNSDIPTNPEPIRNTPQIPPNPEPIRNIPQIPPNTSATARYMPNSALYV